MNIVFCFGHPKSGTTFLQMILNSHPEVSCPSEHQLDYFYNELPKLLTKYNHLLEQMDKRTGNQGCSPFQLEEASKIYITIVELAAKRGAQNKQVKWYGLNDNAIIHKLVIYINLFPNARFVCIARDPRSIAVSSWHHNMRVENDFLARAKDLDNWARQVGTNWNKDMGNLLKLCNDENVKRRLLICKYEELVSAETSHYEKIFKFLDVDIRSETLKNIIELTSFKNMKDDKFFRKASTNEWENELGDNAKKYIEDIAGHNMSILGYRCSTERG